MPTSLAPGYVKGTYDGVLFPHHMTVPVNFSGTPTPGTEPDLVLKDASTLGAIAAIDALLDVIMPFFTTSVHFGLFEAHTVDSVTGEDSFIFAWNAGRTGTSLVARVAAEQIVWSFKTSVGTPYKLYMMEAVEPVNVRVLPPYAAGINADLSDFVVGASSPIYGRGNAYPFVPVSKITKTNDTLRKQQGLA
jgi:hypothetical protein